MQYTIQNQDIKLTVDSMGAEMISVSDVKTGAQLTWPGHPNIWPRKAPILWPYVGTLKNGCFHLDGKEYPGGLHGFARDYDFSLSLKSENQMTFIQRWNEETLKRFPRKYQLKIRFTIEGRDLRQRVTVQNCDTKPMRFGFGYHPGFVFPFDDHHSPEDYFLRFETPQTLHCAEVSQGLLTGKTELYLDNKTDIAMNTHIFDKGSVCLQGIQSSGVSLVERDSGRNIRIALDSFPYLLLWSVPYQDKLHFLCIEPWHTLQDSMNASGDWNDKPCASELQPGQSWQSTLNITFNR